jgi:carboxyl-terminal processing protease
MQENQKKWWLPLAFAMILIMGIVIGAFLKGNGSFSAFTSKQTPFDEISYLIKTKYVDEVNLDSINKKVIADYLEQLDPHSVYIAPEALQEVNEQMTPNYKGIGVEFQMLKDSVFVTYVVPSGPAFTAGIKVGDVILSLNDSIKLSGAHLVSDQVRKQIKGGQDNTVHLNVKRKAGVLKLTLEKANVPMSPIDAFYKINDTTGYIKIGRFAERTYENFMLALDTLTQKGIKGLVIDLRGNGGGLLSEAVAIADELIPGNHLIVYTEGVHSAKVNYFSKREGLFEQGPVTILIDESSASASEVLAGALQDLDRATIVGRTSFGKGLVQQQFRLSNGGAVRLTTAKYFTPLGRNIQRSYAKGKLDYEHNFITRLEEDAKGQADPNKKGDAFKTAKGKVVYGGGGVYPDVWINEPNLYIDSNYIKLYDHNLISETAFRYYLQNKEQIDAIPTVDAFVQYFNSKDVWSYLNQSADANQKGILSKLQPNKVWIQNQMIALIARSRWYKQGYYQVLNQLNPNFSQMLSKS